MSKRVNIENNKLKEIADSKGLTLPDILAAIRKDTGRIGSGNNMQCVYYKSGNLKTIPSDVAEAITTFLGSDDWIGE